jgi:hypothetical protein
VQFEFQIRTKRKTFAHALAAAAAALPCRVLKKERAGDFPAQIREEKMLQR